ncbi:hypothetical protein ACD578_01325 [Microvirga sp. RSM25]|jgi:hypothetical protein|uniref:hypothetical protein n=1 Tax=Microvirga sp. RSM25 TaxID=3273802 RepID=UPI0038507CED
MLPMASEMMLNPINGASSLAGNRILFSVRFAKQEVMTVRLMLSATMVAHREGLVEPGVRRFQQRSLYSIKKVFALLTTS